MKLPKLPPFVRNFYFISFSVFALWMLFFDGNDMVSRWKNLRKLKKAENEKQYFMEKIAQVNTEKEELMGNPELLEKYAREKYLMKKKNEYLYIVEKEK